MYIIILLFNEVDCLCIKESIFWKVGLGQPSISTAIATEAMTNSTFRPPQIAPSSRMIWFNEQSEKQELSNTTIYNFYFIDSKHIDIY